MQYKTSAIANHILLVKLEVVLVPEGGASAVLIFVPTVKVK